MSDAVREWSPSAALVGAAWIGAAGTVAWFVLGWRAGSDPAGLLLAGVAAGGLVIAATFGTRARPRLRADADGITVGGLFGSRHHPWPFVQDVRVLRVRRLGRQTSLLELDTIDAGGAEQLLVFGRLDLAADPQDVAPQLLALRR